MRLSSFDIQHSDSSKFNCSLTLYWPNLFSGQIQLNFIFGNSGVWVLLEGEGKTMGIPSFVVFFHPLQIVSCNDTPSLFSLNLDVCTDSRWQFSQLYGAWNLHGLEFSKAHYLTSKSSYSSLAKRSVICKGKESILPVIMRRRYDSCYSLLCLGSRRPGTYGSNAIWCSRSDCQFRWYNKDSFIPFSSGRNVPEPIETENCWSLLPQVCLRLTKSPFLLVWLPVSSHCLGTMIFSVELSKFKLSRWLHEFQSSSLQFFHMTICYCFISIGHLLLMVNQMSGQTAVMSLQWSRSQISPTCCLLYIYWFFVWRTWCPLLITETKWQ